MVECRWDEFVSDTPANRIIKAIMRRLATCAEIDRSLARRLGRLWRGLDQVANVEPTLQAIRSIQLNRHNAAYGLMLDVCALVLKFLVPADGAGEFRFNDPRRDDAHMARVFQDFLTAWFEQHCDPHEFTSIGATKLNWPAEAIGATDDLKHLPAMFTDITMRGPERVLIIDAKDHQRKSLSASCLFDDLAARSSRRSTSRRYADLSDCLRFGGHQRADLRISRSSRHPQSGAAVAGYRHRSWPASAAKVFLGRHRAIAASERR